MGCLKLSYQSRLRVLEESSLFINRGLEEKTPTLKKDVNTYCFGFNGQEGDNEVAGEGNSYTAEFWQYDSRLGRRWNTDPVVKTWHSPYLCFTGNPLIYADPKGDDDFFDIFGNYIGSTEEGNTVRIVNEGVVFEEAKVDIISNTKLLTEFRYLPEDNANVVMLLNVLDYYGSEAGLNDNIHAGYVDEEKMEKGALAFYTRSENKFHIAIGEESGLVHSDLGDNKYDIINSYVHEKDHQDHDETHKPLEHVNSIIVQSAHSSYEYVSQKFKMGQVEYAKDLLNQALSTGSTIDEVNSQIDKLNASNVGDFGMVKIELFFDESTNTVETVTAMVPIEVNESKPSKK